jgi:hypothetical protein
MKRLIALAAVVLAVAPVVAQRQADTGTRFTIPKPAKIPDNPSLTEAERGRVALSQFAGCLTERSREKVVTALESLESGQLKKLVTGFCLNSGYLKFDETLLRGALYAELYRRDFGTAEITLSDETIDFGKALPADQQSHVPMLLFADCVARSDLKNARTFFLSKGGSTVEGKSFDALRPFIGPCVPAGQTVKLTKSSIGAALAHVIYRQATIQADTGVR